MVDLKTLKTLDAWNWASVGLGLANCVAAIYVGATVG